MTTVNRFALRVGQRMLLPSGNVVQLLREYRRDEPTFECAYVRAGEVLRANVDGGMGAGRVTLTEEFLLVHGREP